MNYICTNDFPNPPGNPIKIADVADFPEKGKSRKQAPLEGTPGSKGEHRHIHKGVIFTIGTAGEYKDLAQFEKTLVAQLMVSKKIAEATSANVKKVDDEVEFDRKRADRDAKLARESRGPTIAEVLGALPELIATAVAAAVAKK